METWSNEHDGVGPPVPVVPMPCAETGQATPAQQLLSTEAGKCLEGCQAGIGNGGVPEEWG